MTKLRVCPKRGCPNLISATEPCPTHGRPKNAPWGLTRTPQERSAQAQLRKTVLARDHHTCTRCGHHDPTGKDLQVHHMRSTTDYRPEHAVTRCRACHRAVDHWAR